LSDFRTNSKYDETTKLRLSYDLLRSVSKVYEMSPCIKRYLSSHIQSRFIEIAANEWDIAALLPVERFEKATKNKVWADSRKKY
jgi:hypothetical protein